MPGLSCDYLVVGAGATAMAFVDELINNSRSTVVMVDTRAKPGGHWNDAYDFVRLHQPAALYGVNSRKLGTGGPDLTSKYQILAYYETVLASLAATGRLAWLPHTRHQGGGRCLSLLEGGRETLVTVRRKVVDGTALATRVPATHPPNYEVGPGVSLVPIGGLARVERCWASYVVVGAGKTGLDALLYLLDQGVDPERIRWIVSNSCWYLNRDVVMEDGGMDGPKAQEAIKKANNLEELYQGFDKCGLFLRVNKQVEPTKMRAATVSETEIEKIRRLKDVVRKGRIERITKDKIIFIGGEELKSQDDSLYIDCSTSGTLFVPCQTIFQPGRIVLQMVQLPAPTMSGAVLAGLELLSQDDDFKNSVVKPVAAPHELEDWFRELGVALANFGRLKKVMGFWWMWRRRLVGVNMVEMLGLGLGLFIGFIIASSMLFKWLTGTLGGNTATGTKLEIMFPSKEKKE